MGRTDGQTHFINVMHALIKFPEYIPYNLGVMAGTRSGPYGRTDGWTDRQTDGRTDGRMGRKGVTYLKPFCYSSNRRGHSLGVMARTRLTIWNLVKEK